MSDAYYGVTRALRDIFEMWQLQVDSIDMADCRSGESNSA